MRNDADREMPQAMRAQTKLTVTLHYVKACHLLVRLTTHCLPSQLKAFVDAPLISQLFPSSVKIASHADGRQAETEAEPSGSSTSSTSLQRLTA
jgi:hypothetical protein